MKAEIFRNNMSRVKKEDLSEIERYLTRDMIKKAAILGTIEILGLYKAGNPYKPHAKLLPVLKNALNGFLYMQWFIEKPSAKEQQKLLYEDVMDVWVTEDAKGDKFQWGTDDYELKEAILGLLNNSYKSSDLYIKVIEHVQRYRKYSQAHGKSL